MTIKHFLGYYIFKGTATSPVNLSRPSVERSDEYAALAGKYAACQSLLTSYVRDNAASSQHMSQLESHNKQLEEDTKSRQV